MGCQMNPDDNEEEGSKFPKPTDAEEPSIPEVPLPPELPEVPQLKKVTLPSQGVSSGGPSGNLGKVFFSSQGSKNSMNTYSKAVIAATVATSLLGPMVVIALLGYWLDIRLHHSVAYLAGIGCVVGFFAGLLSVMDILRRLKK